MYGYDMVYYRANNSETGMCYWLYSNVLLLSILDPNTAISAPRGNVLKGFVSSDFKYLSFYVAIYMSA